MLLLVHDFLQLVFGLEVLPPVADRAVQLVAPENGEHGDKPERDEFSSLDRFHLVVMAVGAVYGVVLRIQRMGRVPILLAKDDGYEGHGRNVSCVATAG